MNSFVIVIVAPGANRRDVEVAWRAGLASLDEDAVPPPGNRDQRGTDDSEPLPMWTWFLLNPLPSQSPQPAPFKAGRRPGFIKMSA